MGSDTPELPTDQRVEGLLVEPGGVEPEAAVGGGAKRRPRTPKSSTERRAAKAPKGVTGGAARLPNPCLDAPLVPTQVATTHYEVVLPFTPSTKGLTAYANHFKHVKVMDRRADPPKVTFDDKALTSLSAKYPDAIYSHLAERREIEKCLGTYVRGIVPFIKRPSGRLCGEMAPTTLTLRLAQRAPSLLNLPRVEGDSIYNVVREMYVAAPGHTLMAVDYSGVEAVLVGYLAKDPTYIRLAKMDPHSFFVSHIIGQPADLSWSDADLAAYLHEIKGREKVKRQAAKKIQHACLTPDHEVLTPQGWVSIADVTPETPVAEWSQGDTLTFRLPQAVHQYAYAGPVVQWDGRGISASMTPEHRVPYVSRQGRAVRVGRADTLRRGRVPVTGCGEGTTTISESLVRIIVALQADAHVGPNTVTWHLKKVRKIARLKTLLALEQIPFKAVITTQGTTKITVTRFALRAALAWFDEVILQRDRPTAPKLFSWRLLTLTPALRQVFLAECSKWDGSEWHPTRRVYCTAVKANADLVQAMAHATGVQALLREDAEQMYVVSFNRRRLARVECAKHTTVTFIGRVYCLTTESGFFLTRRQGVVSVTGNSNYGATAHKAHLEEPRLFPKKADAQRLMDLYHGLFPSVGQWHTAVCDEIEAHGFVTAPSGFRLHYTDVYDHVWSKEKGRWERSFGASAKEAFAAVPQHLGAVALMGAAVTMCREWPEFRDMLRLLIHDEMLFEVPLEEADLWHARVTEVMERPLRCLPCPPEWGQGEFLSVRTEGKRSRIWGQMC